MPDINITTRYAEVPSFSGYRVGTDGTAWVMRGGAWWQLKPQPGYRGYLRVTLYNRVGPKRFLLHRLILTVFVGPCPPGMECRHFPDRDPANCRLDNLSWGSRLRNMADRESHGSTARGERQGLAVLTEDLVRTMRAEHAGGKPISAIARDRKLNEVTIGHAIMRRTWKHVA